VQWAFIRFSRDLMSTVIIVVFVSPKNASY